jgi:Flp pilus assembly protein TadG
VAYRTPHFSRPPSRRLRRQRGAVAVIVSAMLIVLLGVCGMAIDLGFMYNRRVELQNLADATALAAASELDGSPAGVTRALARAAGVAANFRYQYYKSVSWVPAALQFGATPERTGNWVSGDVARTAPDGRLFTRVDTLALDASQGLVSTVFMNVLSASHDAVLQAYAVAGRTGVKVAPLAICAMSPAAANGRVTGAGDELVEFGFRRGISYDLMQLNPNGTTAENFVVNPFAPPGTPGTAGPTSPAIVGPYICNGTMSMSRVTGGTLTVARPFPLASLYTQFNSRFDDYSGNACNRIAAPPDANIKKYEFGSILWMSTAPLGQGAVSLQLDGKLRTVADPFPTPTSNTGGMYGPLWSYARAVPFGAYVPGTPEPASGYTPFASSAWASLYDPGQPAANGYPGTPPYSANAGSNFSGPAMTVRGQRNRRVLNVVLLDCPVAAGTTVSASALGVGKFFMTVPATSSALYAEFAGVVADQALATSTVLFP